MIEAPPILQTLRNRSIFISLRAGGDGLTVHPSNLLTDGDLALIQKNRDAIIQYLESLPKDPAGPILKALGIEVLYLDGTDPELLHTSLEAIEILIKDDALLGLDIETYGESIPNGAQIFHGGLDPNIGNIRVIQIATTDKAWVFDLDYLPDTNRLTHALTSGKFIAHNAIFERQWLKRQGMAPQTLHCSMMMARIAYGLPKGSYPSLAWCADNILGIVLDKALQTSDWSIEEPLSQAQIHYAALDAVLALRLADPLAREIQSTGQGAYYQLTRRALPVVADAMTGGIAFDADAHNAHIPRWEREAQKWRAEVTRAIPEIKNPGSPKQVGEYLQKNLTPEQLAGWPRTDSGSLKTGKSALSAWPECPEPLLKFKQCNSLATTFGRTFGETVHPVTGRIHARFALLGTNSGRFSCSSPNLQNPPSSDEFRSLFIADPGYTLVGADFGQIELRICGILAKDQVILDAYRNGTDLHRLTASKTLGIAPEEVTKAQRTAAKAINFGLIYGMSARTLVQTAWGSYGVKMTLQEAERARAAFFDLYKGVARWQRETSALSEMTRSSRALPGMIRNMTREAGGWSFTKSLNTPVQGAGASVLLASLTRLPEVLEGTDGQLVNHIHDEIILEVGLDDAEMVAEKLQKAMVEGFLEIFPDHQDITRDLVEVHIGQNWSELKG